MNIEYIEYALLKKGIKSEKKCNLRKLEESISTFLEENFLKDVNF